MATADLIYSSNNAITFDISSLAASSTFVAGRESSEIDNTTNKYIDAIVTVDGINGHASTAPTVGQMIQLFVWGSDTSLATKPIDVLDGTDSAETLSHVSVLQSLKPVYAPPVTVATANLKYWIPTFSVATALGVKVLPKFWGLFLSHNHTGSLAASQSGLFQYTGIKLSIA